jgi:hypothetical protein
MKNKDCILVSGSQVDRLDVIWKDRDGVQRPACYKRIPDSCGFSCFVNYAVGKLLHLLGAVIALMGIMTLYTLPKPVDMVVFNSGLLAVVCGGVWACFGYLHEIIGRLEER